VCGAILDEIAFFRTDDTSANVDTEIIAALVPAMATIPNSLLLVGSSPYARRGVLWEAYKEFFGSDAPGAPLVWQAPTRVMNPLVPQSLVDKALEKDPASASAEYLAQFRTDVEALLTREAIEACISTGVVERPPIPGVAYRAFCDPSGGSSDSFTLSIAHLEGKVAVVDCVRERKPPFSPEGVIGDYSEFLHSYRCREVMGDRYGGDFPRELFRKRGITYRVSEKTKSDLYLALVPQINAKLVDLPDIPRLSTQLQSLERRTARGPKTQSTTAHINPTTSRTPWPVPSIRS
jgi:hypothetical protein